MKVSELCNVLEEMNPDCEVHLHDGNTGVRRPLDAWV
jgi:hypothetical protein